MNQTILRLEGVNDRQSAQYYFGKRVAYVYKKHSGKADSRFRVLIFRGRQSGEESQPLTATPELCLQGSARTYLLEQWVLLCELCCSPKGADFYVFKFDPFLS